MSNVIIAPEHQSAPKQTEADKAIALAAREIHEGKFTPERPKEQNAFGKMEDEFWVTSTDALASHPAVKDALAKLETEVRERKGSHEYLEKAEQLHEINCQIRAGHKWQGQQRWQGEDNEAMRLVNLLSPHGFIEKLQKAGISAAMEPVLNRDTKANKLTGVIETVTVESSSSLICLGAKVVRGVVALRAWVDGEYRYIDKLQVPCGPEWTLMRFNEFDLPTNERYHGWRTAVLALIRQRVITEEQAHKAFGKPIENAASAFYREQLQSYRMERIGTGAVWLNDEDDGFTGYLSEELGFELGETA